jgi:hypothetical protein
MKKPQGYFFYFILGLPISITILITHFFGFSGVYNFIISLIMVFFCMFYFFEIKLKDKHLILTVFFMSAGFVLISMFFYLIPLTLILLNI